MNHICNLQMNVSSKLWAALGRIKFLYIINKIMYNYLQYSYIYFF